MHVRKHTVTLTTDASGDAVGYTDQPVSGAILGVIYDAPADAGAGTDLVVSTTDTGQTVLTLTDVGTTDTIAYPRSAVQDAVGADATLDGTRLMREPIYAAGETITVTIADGGDTKTFNVHLLVGG